MNYFLRIVFYIISSLLARELMAQENDWELKKDADGITVHTREVSGTSIKAFKATTIINANEEVLVNILLDVENYPLWIEDVSNAKKLFHHPDSIGMYYQMTLPWPMKDRDMAMISHIEKKANNATLLNIVGADNLVPEKEDFIRITKVNGQWHIKPIEDNKCEITYQFLADPEGFLPAWVVNIFIVDGPFKTLQNLEEYAQEWKK